jgi:hypothetical protein
MRPRTAHWSRLHESSQEACSPYSSQREREEARLGSAITTRQGEEGRGVNREAWLTAAARALRPHFRRAGFVVPQNVRLSVGWPSSGGTAKRVGDRVVAESWNATVSKDGTHEIFISPAEDNPVEIMGHIAHEFLHLCLFPYGTEHKEVYREAMKRAGLIGRPQAARPGKELNEAIVGIVARMKPYPHAAIKL